MFLFKPSQAFIEDLLKQQANLDHPYGPVGSSAGTPPSDFKLDTAQIKIGEGEAAFEAGKSALRRWEQFNLGWIRAYPNTTPIEKGAVVAVVAKSAGLWSVNISRIVYVVNDEGPIHRFGFAYGTLPQHMEMGEERFLIEWDRASNDVSFQLLAFSRPNHILARIGFPWVRVVQACFRRESTAAMRRAVQTTLTFA